MDTLIEMREVLQSDLNISVNSSLYPQSVLDSALNRAYRKGGGLFPWPALEDSLKTTTQANHEYYDAPDNWQPDSMWRLEVNGTPYGEDPDYNPLTFRDYLNWKSDSSNANSTAKKWSAQWLRYFIYPTPTVADLEICIWGLKNVTKMTDDTDTTIFSYNMPELNEAIVLEAQTILERKGGSQLGDQFLSPEAKQIFIVAWTKIKKQQAKYEKNMPFLNVPDFYSSSRNSVNNTIGNFITE